MGDSLPGGAFNIMSHQRPRSHLADDIYNDVITEALTGIEVAQTACEVDDDFSFSFILRLQKCLSSSACDACNTDGFNTLPTSVKCAICRSGYQMIKESEMNPSSCSQSKYAAE